MVIIPRLSVVSSVLKLKSQGDGETPPPRAIPLSDSLMKKHSPLSAPRPLPCRDAVARGVREGVRPFKSVYRHVPFLSSKSLVQSVGLTELHCRLSPLIIALLISVRHDSLVVRLSVSFSFVSSLFISVTNGPRFVPTTYTPQSVGHQ